MHPLLIAAKLTVRNMGGAELAARHLGKSPSTLAHELDPNCAHAKFGLLDAATLVEASGDTRIAAAFAAECGGMFLLLPRVDDSAAGEDTSRLFAKLAAEFGDVLTAAGAAVADGRVTDRELGEVQKQGLELMGALQSLMVHLGQRNQAAKGPALQAVA